METTVKNDNDFNDVFSDYRAMTPDEWRARVEQIIRRAKDERDRAIRAAFVALFSWLSDAIARSWTAVFAGKHPALPRGGV
jgi:hypothetical protein